MQANVENQMLIITSNSQKHQEQVASLSEFPRLMHFPVCKEPLMGINFEEKHTFLHLPETLAELQTQLGDVGVSFINQLLQKGIEMNSFEVLPPAVDRKTLLKWYCNLNFDPTTASEELLLFKETHSVLNLGILLEDVAAAGGPFPGFKQWPQVLCSRGLSEGRHYWEVEVSNSWVCLGVTYRRRPTLSGRPRRNIVHLLGRNPYSWCLEWDSLKFSVWHNTQTVLHGAYHPTLGVALDCGGGCLSFYGVAGGMSLLYRFLAPFLEPLYPAVMVSSAASVTLRQRPGRRRRQ
ncbi:Tripartite Motif-Containing Protein 65 [Manis pentadactyla]|nr:Tripartite Motif-Containing Protein 65 [Manis pentadactyla]